MTETAISSSEVILQTPSDDDVRNLDCIQNRQVVDIPVTSDVAGHDARDIEVLSEDVLTKESATEDACSTDNSSCSASDSESNEDTDNDSGDNKSEEVLPDFTALKAYYSNISNTRLKKMGKDQLIELFRKCRETLCSALTFMGHLKERIQRDNSVHFAGGSDSSLFDPPKPGKRKKEGNVSSDEANEKTNEKEGSDDSTANQNTNSNGSESENGSGSGSENENENGSENENENGKKDEKTSRRGCPKRQVGFTKHRDDRIPILLKDCPATEEQLLCEFQDHPYQHIGTHCLEDYVVLPSQVYLLRRTVHTYKDMITGQFFQSLTASKDKLFPGSRLTSSLLAYLADEYYFNMDPVNRQVKRLESGGCHLSKQEVYHWLRRFGEDAIEPIATRMLELVLQSRKIQMDETYFTCLEEMKNTGRKNCYIWQARTSELLSGHQIIAEVFTTSRSAEELQQILGKEFEGTIATDGYSAYPAVKKKFCKLIIACCLWHVYHQFTNVFRGIANWKELTEDERKAMPAYQLSLQLQDIFKEEAILDKVSREERLTGRNEIILPRVNSFYEEVEKYHTAENFDQGSLFGKAITYAVNRKEYILAGVIDPDMPLHNLASERTFISSSVFRNNSKFFGTNKGARTAAAFFTVGNTCKANGRQVRIYFQYLVETIPQVMAAHIKQIEQEDYSFLDEYMPWCESYKAYERKLENHSRNLLYDVLNTEVVAIETTA